MPNGRRDRSSPIRCLIKLDLDAFKVTVTRAHCRQLRWRNFWMKTTTNKTATTANTIPPT